MASKMIGRADCPECGFKAAHVKQSEKCTYRYCPECGAQHHAKTERQVADLLKKTRLIDPTPTPTPTESPGAAPIADATPTPTQPTPTQASPNPTPPDAPKRRGLFS